VWSAAACCRFDEASLLAVGVWVWSLVIERKEFTPGSRLPERESGSGLPQSKQES
jgi:hypothetical protein